MVTSSLGTPKLSSKGKPLPANTWDYGGPEEQALPIADIIQEGGRVARLDTRSGVTATVLILNNFERDKDGKDITVEIELDNKKDLASKFVEVCHTGNIPSASNWPAKFKEVNFLRALIALPYKYGCTTAESLCGSGVSMAPYYPYYDVRPGANGTYSEKLWKAHIRQKDPIVVDTERAELVLLLQTQSYLEKQAGTIQDGLLFKIESPLIKEVGWIVGDEEAITKLRSVLNKVIFEKVGDKVEFSAKEKNQFLNAVAWKRISNGVTIDIVQEYKDKEKKKPKDNLTILFSYILKRGRSMRKIFETRERGISEVENVEIKKEGLITSVCEKCEREFPFHQLMPNNQGELFCLEGCFQVYQEELHRKEQVAQIEQETKKWG